MTEDRTTLEALYQATAPGLLAFLCARLGDHAWAEDVLHDVFVACMDQDWRAIRSPRGYLFRTAHHLSLNALRARARADRARQRLATDAAWEARDPSELARELADALALLPQEVREVLVLRAYGGMTFKEAAAVLDTPLTTVFLHYRQGIERLRRILDAEGRPR